VRALLVACAFAWVSSSCSAPAQEKFGVSALASDRSAQLELRRLRERYFSELREARAPLRAELSAFLSSHAADPSADWARLYLALLEVDERNFEQARRLIDEVKERTVRRVRDLAEIAAAALLRAEGKPKQAILLLTPLRGKLVDPHERELYYQELVGSALAAKEERFALQAAYEGLARGEGLRLEAEERRLHRLLSAVSVASLEQAFAELLKADAGASRSAEQKQRWQRWRRALRQELVKRALEGQDAELARRLLSNATLAERRAESTSALSSLAVAGAASKPRVLGRRLGFVFAMGSSLVRARSAEAARGIAQAFADADAQGLPAVQLATEVDTGEAGALEAALRALVGQGASILLAGVDEESAEGAAAFAREAKLPLITLALPEQPEGSKYVYSVGLADAVVRQVLEQAQGQPAHFVVAATEGACTAELGDTEALASLVLDWRKRDVASVLFMSDAACTDKLVGELSGFKLRPWLLLGPSAAHRAPDYRGFRRLWLEPLGAAGPARLAPWFERLAFDAATLASVALRQLPADLAEEAPGAIRKLHEDATLALSQARAAGLYSTDEAGFARRVLGRRMVPVGREVDESAWVGGAKAQR
jgi:hypothetical protein